MSSIAVADDSKNRLFNRRLMLSVIAIALLTIMAVSLISNADDADSAFKVDGLSYEELPNETEKVEVVKSKVSGAIIVPSSITDEWGNTYSVTAIAEKAFMSNVYMTSITIPSSVTSIGDYAFMFCVGLKSVTLDANITAINERTFYACSDLTEISIPASVNSIGKLAFSGCTGLTKISVHNPTSVPSTENDSFKSCGSIQEIYVPYTNYDDYYSSQYWSEMKDKMRHAVEIPIAKSDLVYNGSPQTGIEENDKYTITTDHFGIVDAGDYCSVVMLKLSSPTVYWFDGTLGLKQIEWSIAKRPVDVTDIAVDDKTYDGTTAATARFGSISGILSGDDLTVTIGSAVFDDKDVGADRSVTVSFVKSGTDADNYELVFDMPKANITKRSVILTSASDSKTYDRAPLTNVTVAVSGDGFADGEGATYDVTGTQTAAGTSDNSFTYTLNPGTDEGNYEISTVYGTLTVKKAESVIAISKDSSCVDKNFNVGATNTGDGMLSYEITSGADVVSVGANGDITASSVGTAKLKITAAGTDNYEEGVKVFEILINGHNHVTVPGKIPTATESGLTEGERCSECGEIFVKQDVIAPTQNGHSVVETVDARAEFDVPGSGEIKTLVIKLNDDLNDYRIELDEKSTDSVEGKHIDFSIESVTDREDTYVTAMTADGKEFKGDMDITLPYDPEKGTPSIRWIEGGEDMETVSVNETDRTITFSTTHNSTYEVVYSKPFDSAVLCLWSIPAILFIILICSLIYATVKKE